MLHDLLLPLLAGGGWEGVKLLIFNLPAEEPPLPSPPLQAGEGIHLKQHLQRRAPVQQPTLHSYTCPLPAADTP